MKLRIIGITGYRGSGKSTLANFLCARSTSLVRYSLATPVKEAAAMMVGRPIDTFFRDSLKSEPIPGHEPLTHRDLMIRVGMMGRDIHPDFWIRNLSNRLQADRTTQVVVDDIRFINEVKWLRSHGGILVRACAMPGTPAPEAEPELEEVMSWADMTVGSSTVSLSGLIMVLRSRGFTF